MTKFLRTLAAAGALLAALPALAFEPSQKLRYPSPDLNAPNVDKIIIQGPGSTGDVSGMSIPAPSPSGLPATLADINASRYSLAQEGGWGKTQADNDRIFQLALAYSANVANGPVTIDVPMGTWRLTVPRTLTTTKPFKMRCAGRGQTKIIVDTGAGSLLTLVQQGVNSPVSIEGCEFQAASPGVGTPLVLSMAGTSNGPSPFYQFSTLTLRDLSFSGLGNTATTGLNYFLNALDLKNFWAPILDGIHVTGSVINQRAMQSGVISRFNFSMQVENYFHYYSVKGFDIVGGDPGGQNDEGFAFRSGEILGVDYGIDAIGTDADPGFTIVNSHFNVSKSGIRTKFKSQVTITGNLVYKLAGDSENFIGIDIEKCAYGMIANNQIADSRSSNAGGTFIGMRIVDSPGVTVNGLQAQSWTNATGSLLYLDGTTDTGRFHGIDAAPVPGLNPIGLGPGVGKQNRFFNTLPAVTQGLAVNSATPSVGNDRSGLWTTANSAATSITNFPDPATGQKITIFFQDAATTLVHGTPIRLRGAINATAPSGSSITLQYFGAFWVEVARSF